MASILERSERFLRIRTFHFLNILVPFAFGFTGLFFLVACHIVKETGRTELECTRVNEQITCTEQPYEFFGSTKAKSKEFLEVTDVAVVRTRSSGSSPARNSFYTLHLKAKVEGGSSDSFQSVGYSYTNDRTIVDSNLAVLKAFLGGGLGDYVSIEQTKSFDIFPFLVTLSIGLLCGYLSFYTLVSDQIIIDKEAGTIKRKSKFLSLFFSNIKEYDPTVYKSIRISRDPEAKKEETAYRVGLFIEHKKDGTLELFDRISQDTAKEYGELIHLYLPNLPIEYQQKSTIENDETVA